MSCSFLPAIPGECLPCEFPRELVARLAARDGVRGMFKVLEERTVTDDLGATKTVPTISAYSRNDPGLSDDDAERIASGARRLVLVRLSSGELSSFVRCNEAGAYYRVPSDFWAWWAGNNMLNGAPLPVDYEASPFHVSGDDKFLGAKLMIAKADGDAVIGNLPPRPAVTTSVVCTPLPNQPPSKTANENCEPVFTNKNGCQGRPSVLHLCEAIMRGRHADGLTLANITPEAQAIIDAFKQDDRCKHLPPPGHSTVKNGLGKLYKQLTGVVDWPDRDRGQ